MDKGYLTVCKNKRMDRRRGCRRTRSCDHCANDAFPRIPPWLIQIHNPSHSRDHRRGRGTDKNKSYNARKPRSRSSDRAYCPQFSGPASPRPARLRLVTSRRESAPSLPMPDPWEKGSGKFQGVRKFASRRWNKRRELECWLAWLASAPRRTIDAS